MGQSTGESARKGSNAERRLALRVPAQGTHTKSYLMVKFEEKNRIEIGSSYLCTAVVCVRVCVFFGIVLLLLLLLFFNMLSVDIVLLIILCSATSVSCRLGRLLM